MKLVLNMPTASGQEVGSYLVWQTRKEVSFILVEKGPGGEVVGGTLNRTGLLRFRATRVGAETALAQIIRLVEDAQATSAPIQRIADRVTAYFVPAVVGIAVAAFLGWWALGDFPQGLLASIAVLIIA